MLAVLSASILGATGAAGQDKPLRAGMLGSPALGKAAPAVVLPYLTAAGPGPEDQPFRLSSELGRVVVLLFSGEADSLGRAGWEAAIGRAAPLTGRSVVVAGVVRDRPEAAQPMAEGVGGDLKYLVDADGRVHRLYGVGKTRRPWSAFVVGDDGRLVWSGRVDPESAEGWSDLSAAVRRGRTAIDRTVR